MHPPLNNNNNNNTQHKSYRYLLPSHGEISKISPVALLLVLVLVFLLIRERADCTKAAAKYVKGLIISLLGFFLK